MDNVDDDEHWIKFSTSLRRSISFHYSNKEEGRELGWQRVLLTAILK